MNIRVIHSFAVDEAAEGAEASSAAEGEEDEGAEDGPPELHETSSIAIIKGMTLFISMFRVDCLSDNAIYEILKKKALRKLLICVSV